MLAYIISILLIILPLLFVNKPKHYIYFVFIVGLFPMSWIGSVPTPIGSLSVSAIKLLGIIISTIIGIFSAQGKAQAIISKLWPFFIFFIITILSLAWSPSFSMGFRMILKLIAPFTFAIYIACNMQQISHQELLKAIIISGGLSIFAAIVSTGLGLSGGYFGIPGSNRAVFSAHLTVVISILGAYAIITKKFKYIFWTLVVASAILGAFTRITILSMFIAIGIMAFKELKGISRIALPIVGVFSILTLFLTVDTFKERMFNHKAESVSMETAMNDPNAVMNSVAGSGRFAAWESTFELLFYPNPILGSGIGATQFFFYGSGKGDQISAVHSEYIRLACDVGVLGISFYIIGWIYLLILLFNTKAKDFHQSVMILSSIGASFAYLIFLATDNGLDYASSFGDFVFALITASLINTKIHQNKQNQLVKQPVFTTYRKENFGGF